MKSWSIEVQKIKAMAHGHGLVRAQVDALVAPQAAREEGVASSVLTLTEENARVLLLLLKQQLAEIDARRPKSRR